MITIAMPGHRILRLFPETATLAVLEAALVAAESVLREVHPTVHDLPFDPEHDVAPSLLTAYLILSRATELRDLLHLYSAAVRRAGSTDFDTDGLF